MRPLEDKLETRTLQLEVRVEGEDKEPRLVGYAIRWGELSQPLPFLERFRRGAFAKTLEEGREVLALVDHDRSKVLGRRSNGTLELREDDQGLLVTIRPNMETSYGRDVVAAVRRRDVAGMSVGFIARREEWVPDEQVGQVREVIEADLREVSIASMPAYLGTSVTNREEMTTVEERKENQAVAQVATETPQETREATKGPEPQVEPAREVRETPKTPEPEPVQAREQPKSEERRQDRAWTAGNVQQAVSVRVDPMLSSPLAETRSAFAAWIRGESYDIRALGLSPATAGGVLAPESFQAELIRALNEQSVMRRIARVIGPIAAAQVRFPALTQGVTAAWTDEGQPIVESDATFSQVVFTPRKLGALTLVSNELLADSAINVEALLAQLFGEAFAQVEDAAFFTGGGDTAKQPEGILTNSSVPTVTAQAKDTVDVKDILKLYDSLPAPYRANAVWVMNPATMSILRQLVDGSGRYLLVEGLAASAPTTLLGRPVYLSSNMPTVGSGTKSIAFGDFSRAYYIVDRQGVDVQRSADRYFESDQIAFRAIRRVDGKVVLPQAVRCLKHPTS